MIHLIIGRQGTGKTLFLVKIAKEAHKAGKTIYSNVHFKFPYKKLNYNDIINCKLENGVVILDEIHLLLSARGSLSKINREVCDGFLSMVRKKNLEVYGTTQTPRKVDVRFREEQDFFYIASKYAYINKQWKEVLHNQNLNIDIPILIKLDVQEMFSGNSAQMSFIANSYFNMFDSTQVIKITGIKEKKK